MIGGMHVSKNLQAVLDILKNEVDGDVRSALEKMTEDYSMTWMYQRGDELFPSTGKDVSSEMKEVYPIKGRKYDIRNVAEGDNVVMVELIESYPDPDTGQEFRTPLVLVLEMKDGQIRKGRHYCDPRVSFLHLSEKQVEGGFKGTDSKKVVE
jgi:ketosteroid isomerase-like protein